MNKPTTERIASIDIFRSLMILTMIFVYDLASIHNIPAWMKHASTEANAMAFVDLVFPAFLFTVCMAIPFAIQKQIDRGETIAHIWKHILIRTLGLIVLGVFMVNMEFLKPSAAGILQSLWRLLLFIAAILVWNQYPKAEGWKRIMIVLLRFAGFVILIFLAVIYRGDEGDEVHWMQNSWWGILG